LVGKAALFHFAEHGTSLKFSLPKTLKDPSTFSGDPDGRFLFRDELKGWKTSKFLLDIASGRQNETNEQIVRMETKVICEGEGVPELKSSPKFIKDVANWLEFAHGITSPFFKDLITPSLMTKFEGK
jgi:hypothetical protein